MTGRFRSGRWLLLLFLMLSSLEFMRVAWAGRPVEWEYGFHPWENVQLADGNHRYHWTRGSTAYVQRVYAAPVLRVPLYLAHPRVPDTGVSVTIWAGEQRLDRVVLQQNGWRELRYYLPPWVGALPAPQAAVAVERNLPDFLRLFDPAAWRRPAGPFVRLRFEVEPTFVPARLGAGSDRRRLGVGVGEIVLEPELPPDGVGLYGWESDAEGPFRWTRQRASITVPVPPGSGEARLPLRASPAAASGPVYVSVWWNHEQVFDRALADESWQQLRLPVPQGSSAVLTLVVDRVWVEPRPGGVGPGRTLGVAIRPVVWR